MTAEDSEAFVAGLSRAYYDQSPDVAVPAERVSFGTSGHRGSALRRTFNESHLVAIVQAVCDYRGRQGYRGPLFIGRDTHALSIPAYETALEVLAANAIETRYSKGDEPTPTPAVSHAILRHNRAHPTALADGLVITPSHNPPADGGIKYNPPHGGPADTDATAWIEARANELLATKNADAKRLPYAQAIKHAGVVAHDFIAGYVDDLDNVLDMAAIASSQVSIGVDPLGGANLGYWDVIVERYGIRCEVVNRRLDPTFSFMPKDHDGQIRMDCSSPHAMAGLVALRDRFDIAFGNDPDSDRHGIVTPSDGLMNPNHYLVVAMHHLVATRRGWSPHVGVGKTVVTSSLVDRVVAAMGRPLFEVPVGFKWFVEPLTDGRIAFGGEESAGASFLRNDGQPWTTDKDGMLLGLLAAEILATTGHDPSWHYRQITAQHGAPVYVRRDIAATPKQKAILKRLSPDAVVATELAGEPILARQTRAPGNGAEIGGLKVSTKNAWFAARPSGTEDVYKIYAESFLGEEHLARVVEAANAIVAAAFG